jgi:hypothetical protein
MDLTAKDFEGKNLAQRLALIAGAVGYVQKKGFNKVQSYKFVREADLVDAVRPLLALAGVVMLPNVVWQERIEIPTKSGTTGLCRIQVEYDITDGVDHLKVKVMGEGADNQDKASYKAMTGAQKYAIYKTFQIATGDDPEEEEEDKPTARASAAAAITQTLGGTIVDAKEMAYVRLGECQTLGDLHAAGAKEKIYINQPWFKEYLKDWAKKESELKNAK